MALVLKSNVPYTGNLSDLPFYGLLNVFASAAAFSLRRLGGAYNGSAIRVRRSSDNAEQDIGFSNGVLNTGALTSFVGSGDGFVKTWYDQSGNNFHASQATAGSQPKIVSSGSVILKNSHPTILFDGVDDALTYSAPNIFRNIAKGYILGVFAHNKDLPSGATVTAISTGAGNNRAALNVLSQLEDSISASARRLDSEPSQIVAESAGGTLANGVLALVTGAYLYGSGTVSVAKNLAAATSATFSGSGNSSDTAGTVNNVIGANTALISNSFYVGHMSELLVFNTDVSASLTDIKTNIVSAYGIS